MSLSIEEQVIWNRIANKALAQKRDVSFRYGGLTKKERLELLKALEHHLDNYPDQPFSIRITKPWYKFW